jgi:HD superfamily phosphodiesterase
VVKNNSEILQLILNNPPFTNIEFGIHGRAHASRVLLFANLLSNIIPDRVDTWVITIASLLHDCGRVNNGHDPYHGTNSANLAIKFIDKHKLECNKELVYSCIERHCPPPKYIDENPSLESKIVGDSDKLDRFRFLRQKAPCNPKFLELKESILLMDLSARINGHKWRSFK